MYHKSIIEKFDNTFSGGNPPHQDNLNPPLQDNLNLSLQDNLNPSESNQNHLDDETSTTTNIRNDMFVHSQVRFVGEYAY
jgi:hypothetical protein